MKILNIFEQVKKKGIKSTINYWASKRIASTIKREILIHSSEEVQDSKSNPHRLQLSFNEFYSSCALNYSLKFLLYILFLYRFLRIETYGISLFKYIIRYCTDKSKGDLVEKILIDFL